MTKKKKTIIKKENKREIFDANGKLILPNNNKNLEKQLNEFEKNVVTTMSEVENKMGKKPRLAEEERIENHRKYWREYYHKNKEKYKQWNKNWREKQKSKQQSNVLLGK
ncbi:MAG: hypothetical protein MUO82_11345 [Candidatus Thermoplasmatota archaeon]|nr:hypothetical protein [Candidatus Thermoplasmatota archaeon]